MISIAKSAVFTMYPTWPTLAILLSIVVQPLRPMIVSVKKAIYMIMPNQIAPNVKTQMSVAVSNSNEIENQVIQAILYYE